MDDSLLDRLAIRELSESVHGRYDVEYVKQDGRWLFKSRAFQVLHVE